MHTELPPSFRHDDGVGQPLRVLDLSDEPGVEELVHLEADELLPLDGLLVDLLLDGPKVGEDLQSVLNHIPGDPGHIRRLPSKHVDMAPEECDELEFLFLR